MAKNTGKVREFCQSGKVGTLFLVNCTNLCSRQVKLNENAFASLFQIVCIGFATRNKCMPILWTAVIKNW